MRNKIGDGEEPPARGDAWEDAIVAEVHARGRRIACAGSVARRRAGERRCPTPTARVL
ncbi:MAG: hypothetical protein WKG32_19165 [Gemmatimonadaceae bacterium]